MTRTRNRGLARVLVLARRLEGDCHMVNLSALAREFGVSERTIRRDLQTLAEAGGPVPLGLVRDAGPPVRTAAAVHVTRDILAGLGR